MNSHICSVKIVDGADVFAASITSPKIVAEMASRDPPQADQKPAHRMPGQAPRRAQRKNFPVDAGGFPVAALNGAMVGPNFMLNLLTG
jgi:hypothetical protein